MKKDTPIGYWSQYSLVTRAKEEDVNTSVKEAMKIAACIAGGAFIGFSMVIIAFTF